MSLPLVRNDLHVQTATLGTSTLHLAGSDSRVNQVLDVSLQPSSEVFVQRASTGQHNVLVESTANIDWRRLDNIVDNSGERGQKVG